MHSRRRAAIVLMIVVLCAGVGGCGGGGSEKRSPPGQALRLNPDNPRFVDFRGRTTVLVTSSESYGALVNADFDYRRYLATLSKQGLNLTRVFSGAYVQHDTGYRDTLNPRPGRFVYPWAQAGRGPGGHPKLDLTKWNPAYWTRLRKLVAEAGKRGIAVEHTLFSALYTYDRWKDNPFYVANNVNGVGTRRPQQLYTLRNGRALRFQDAFVRKTVKTLGSYDNVYFEVFNEPFEEPAKPTDGWQRHVVRTIQRADAGSPQKHLIAQNYAQDTRRIRPTPGVSVFNFHYMRDPSRFVGLKGVLSFDETGLQGQSDRPYRQDAWFFLLSGGGVYDNLDNTFIPGREDGSYRLRPGDTGQGGPGIRRSLAVLKRFMDGFDLAAMEPAPAVVLNTPKGAAARVLEDPGNAYAVYVQGGRRGRLVLDLPAGTYRAQWIDTKDGHVRKTQQVEGQGGPTSLTAPSYPGEIALAIRAK